jgi:hypothetical protein
MGWMTRLVFVVAGLLLILAALSQMRAGQFVFDNESYHQQTFAAGGIGIGIVVILLAFLPSRDWLYKHITTKHSRGRQEKKLR